MADSGQMAPPPRPHRNETPHKRSRDETIAETLGEEIAPFVPQDKSQDTHVDAQSVVKADDPSQMRINDGNISPPATSPVAATPPSGQPEQVLRSNTERTLDQTDLRATKRREPSAESEQSEEEGSASEVDELSDPQLHLGEFDWHSLKLRYHTEMQQMANREGEIFQEFSDLCNYFSIWAEAGSGKDTDRSFKRLKTQEYYVQNEEAELEQRRKRYVKATMAFKSALELLQD